MGRCRRCEHVKEHGRIGLLPGRRVAGSHCQACHRDWITLAQSHCTVCREQDSTERRHRTQDGHLHPSQLSRLVAHDERWGSFGGWRHHPACRHRWFGDGTEIQDPSGRRVLFRRAGRRVSHPTVTALGRGATGPAGQPGWSAQLQRAWLRSSVRQVNCWHSAWQKVAEIQCSREAHHKMEQLDQPELAGKRNGVMMRRNRHRLGAAALAAGVVASVASVGLTSGAAYADSPPSATLQGVLSGVTQVAAGGLHTCAVLTGGTVDCWGTTLTASSATGSCSPAGQAGTTPGPRSKW
jgi:hypothetical protein